MGTYPDIEEDPREAADNEAGFIGCLSIPVTAIGMLLFFAHAPEIAIAVQATEAGTQLIGWSGLASFCLARRLFLTAVRADVKERYGIADETPKSY